MTGPPKPSEARTGIIRRHPTGAFPALPDPHGPDAETNYVEIEDPTTHVPRVEAPPPAKPSPKFGRPRPHTAVATATVSILSGWATSVIATSLISSWWATDRLFCVAIGFLTAVSASATIGGLISVLLRRPTGRVLVVVGAIVALMIFAGLFVAGAKFPPIVYAIPVLPVASIVGAVLPATGRWCR